MDSNLLWDKAQFNAYAEEVTETDAETGAETVTRTVDYLCFWDNGTDSVDWNAPGLFRYNIYIKALDGESTEGKTTRAYGGDTYYLRGTPLDTCDDAGEVPRIPISKHRLRFRVSLIPMSMNTVRLRVLT